MNNDDPTLFIYNASAVKIANNEAPTKRCKHIDIKHLYLQDLTTNDGLYLKKNHGKDIIASSLTKQLTDKPSNPKWIELVCAQLTTSASGGMRRQNIIAKLDRRP
eukprot:gb/GEZJ01006485.1/.p1 GENE.gb/GEZJ01006485.1/~~gb/GEZJ01006485.1/.p1  ORF type:complete len:105 (+),score=13.17 gb/GEZJ01006485.1/:236-550(+)